MSEFNSCASLANNKDLEQATKAYDEAIKNGKDPLQIMLDMQTGLQIKLAEKFPETVMNPTKLEKCGDILKWLRLQDDFIQDETRELYTALGGMSNGKEASAVWKPWKSAHAEAIERNFSDLSDEDRLEVYFEMIDQIHFILAKLIGLGLSAEDVFKLYYLKNAENFARQERGY